MQGLHCNLSGLKTSWVLMKSEFFRSEHSSESISFVPAITLSRLFNRTYPPNRICLLLAGMPAEASSKAGFPFYQG
jgi:hypothetical protein